MIEQELPLDAGDFAGELVGLRPAAGNGLAQIDELEGIPSGLPGQELGR
jgi:hypothetical protein